MTVYIFAGAVLVLGVLLFVLLPLFRPATGRFAAPPMGPAESPSGPVRGAGTVVSAGASDVGSAIDILREIEFDRATGKLSDADYADLKASYTGPALAELRRRNAGESGDAGGPSGARASAQVAAAGPTVCPTCGPRPESDARYCSACARYLPGECAVCGAPVTEPAAQYCSGCGQRLAA